MESDSGGGARRAGRGAASRAAALLAVALALGAGPAAGRQGAAPEPHVFARVGPGLAPGASGTCTYCHLPGDGRAGSAAVGRALPGAASLGCLTCHDGVQAVEVAARMPRRGVPGPFGLRMGEGGRADHPVGVPLSGFSGRILRGADGVEGIARLRAGAGPQGTRWWVDTEPVPNGRRDASDLLLYAGDAPGGLAPFVECATCHDPHGAAGHMYLRAPNAGSALCRACHEL